MAVILRAPLSTAFVTICKKSFIFVADENDELVIGNLGALKYGLEALTKEDTNDYDEAAKLWAEARRLLVVEESNNMGAGSEGNIELDDSFNMEAFPVGL